MGQMAFGWSGFNNKVWGRKYRWFIEINKAMGASYKSMCVSATRPSVTLEEKELMHVTEKIYYPAKITWEPIKVIFNEESTDKSLWQWLNEAYSVTSGEIGSFDQYISMISLVMYDGQGSVIQKWEIYEAWICNLNYGELDFSTVELSTVEASIRYSRANQVM